MEASGGLEVDAHDEGFHAACATTTGLGHDDLFEEDLELGVENVDVSTAEDLGDEFTSGLEDTEGQVKSGKEQLGLNVNIEVMETSHIRSTIA
ncbi:hypothetical protein HG531_008645 [Fusarium graminearum]|nr:hypothetical protein HG531_008645 [Fusarium graminearum]